MQEWQAIKAFVKRQPEKLAVYFHHFPLVKIHPLAFDEAVVAKKVSTTGSFLKIHDLLYKLTADKNAIKAILKENGIKADIQPWEISFRTQVSNDLQLGLQLGVKGTPYMIYIDSANNAFHLSSINSLKV
jgi:protein-disulfide isomerase